MKYYLYRMSSNDRPPGGGDFRGWLHFYKWGRPETVVFYKRKPYYQDIKKGDVLFFVLDGFLIGDALVEGVQEGTDTTEQGIEIGEGDIWEYLRKWSLW